MLIEHRGKAPRIAAGSRIAPNATICGDVTIGENCSVGFGCVITAESGPISIADNCIIMDTAVLRGIAGAPLSLGRNVLVGPRAYLSGCTIANEVFLATGCSVFNLAEIGSGAEVRINGVVHIRTVLAAGATVPIGWVAVGNPARILPPGAHDEIWAVQRELDFPGTVFGVDRPAPGGSIMPEVMPRYARSLGRHEEDVIVG